MARLDEGASQWRDERLKLLTQTYDEVLDATKHQDDKIGRLLTAIAFLTAGALAVANLDTAKLIRTQIDLGSPSEPRPVALGAVFLVAFLLGVLSAVIQLISSLSAPLRFPGMPSYRSEPPKPNFPTTLYFHEIEKSTLEDWLRLAVAPSLPDGRIESLAREAHNLARRTSFKYARTTEAVAVVTWALVSLSLAVCVFCIDVLNPTPSSPISLTSSDMVLLGTVVAFSSLLWSVARIRHAGLGLREESNWPRRQRVVVAMATSLALLVGVGFPLVLRDSGFYGYLSAALTAFTVTLLIVGPGSLATDLLYRRRRWVCWLAPAACLAVIMAGAVPLDPLPPTSMVLVGAFLGGIAAILLATLVAFKSPEPAAQSLLTTKAVGHARVPLVGPAFPSECEGCRALVLRSRLPGRALALAFAVVAGLALEAGLVLYLDTLAYAWILIAGCLALTTLVASAALEPTYNGLRQRRERAARRAHLAALAPATAGTDG